MSANYGHSETCELLVKLGADINAKDKVAFEGGGGDSLVMR